MLPVSALLIEEYHQAATGRKSCYALLAEVFASAPTADSFVLCAQGFAGLEDLFARLPGAGEAYAVLRAAYRDESGEASGETLERLSREYSALFETHNRIYPNASCWEEGHRPQLLGEAARRAQDSYQAAGFTMAEGELLKVDHIATELLFLSYLAEPAGGSAAGEGGDADGASGLEQSRNFFEQVFLPWAPRFFDAVGEAPERSAYYAAWARLARAFIDADAAAWMN